MKSLIASVFLGVVFIAAPVFAQGKPPASGGSQQLASDLAALTARVAKLEGNIVANDLVGTYSLNILSTDMNGPDTDTVPPGPAKISTSLLRLRMTLNANGTASLSPSNLIPGAPACQGATLFLNGTMAPAECEDEGTTEVTWAYANGVVTLTFLNGAGADDDEMLPFDVGLGGRFLILAGSQFFPGGSGGSDHVQFIASRLQ